MQDTSQVYVDAVLTNVSLAYHNTSLIGEQIFPTLEVPAITGYAFKFDKQNLKKPVSSERDGFARANRVDFQLTKTAYGPLKEHSLEIGIPQAVLDLYQAPLVPETNATNNVTERLAIEKETIIADAVTNATYFPAANKVTLSGTSQFSDYTNSDPLGAFQTAKAACLLQSGHAPNKAVMGRQVYDVLINHPKLYNRLGTANRSDEATVKAALAALMGVDEVLIGQSVQNTAVEGGTDALGFIWGKVVTFLYVAPAPALETLSAGYLLQLAGKQYVDKWYETARKAQFVRANDFYLPWAVAYEAMYLINAAVA